MYLKEPAKIVPLADLSDTGEPMTLFIYPPYRTGLREADTEEVPRDMRSPTPVPPTGGNGPSTELDVRRPVASEAVQLSPETSAPSTELSFARGKLRLVSPQIRALVEAMNLTMFVM